MTPFWRRPNLRGQYDAMKDLYYDLTRLKWAGPEKPWDDAIAAVTEEVARRQHVVARKLGYGP